MFRGRASDATPGALTRLADMARRDPDWPVRARAVELSAGIAALVPTIIEAVEDPAPRVREAALHTIASSRLGSAASRAGRALASNPAIIEPVGEQKSAEADRNRQWREVGVGAQILRDLGITSIVNLTSSVHDYKGLSGFGIEIVANEKLEG